MLKEQAQKGKKKGKVDEKTVKNAYSKGLKRLIFNKV